jgi:hypothetical protein
MDTGVGLTKPMIAADFVPIAFYEEQFVTGKYLRLPHKCGSKKKLIKARIYGKE